MSSNVTPISPARDVAHQLEEMAAKFREALPAHIPVERFTRVVATAIQQTPALLKAERRSLWQAAMKAAQDGLLPDGREAALVIYRDRNRGEIAQYMPMIAGLRKKVRNSGEIATWDAHVVYENDEFAYELGDEPFIRHRPALVDRGKPIAAYSIAVLKSGEKSREVMSFAEIEAVRGRSRAKDSGPWVTDWAEMARKTVARRHAKVLPMSTDLDDLMRRDDDLYDFKGDKDDPKPRGKRPTLAGGLDALATAPSRLIEHDAETGEITEPGADAPQEAPANEPVQAAGAKVSPPAPAPAATDPLKALRAKLEASARAGIDAYRTARAGLSKAETALLAAELDEELLDIAEAADKAREVPQGASAADGFPGDR